ncbi:autotransporter domain-containing protein [Pseudovibrio brasiliensis]|uniref:autotransporter domain-containing protein n=1 Tax=Pseudovibrio brasiliensis TaxID=1898042 RepID=UPI00117B5B95|nr:autotransporter domain-containing protein [Pseudovibrio brasiliensis]
MTTPSAAQTVNIIVPNSAPNDASLDTQVITGPITEHSDDLQITVTGGNALGSNATAEIIIRGIKDEIKQDNSGSIRVEVSGGTAGSTASSGTNATADVTIDGIEGTIERDNVGSITAKGVSKTAITSGSGHASVKVNVKAVDDRILGDNLGHLSSYAEAGEATALGSGNADASVEGFGTYLDVHGDNVGTIKAEGYAGTAKSGTGFAYADADITGIDNDLEGENKGLIQIIAKGGQSRADGTEKADSETLAIGVKGYAEANSGTILVDADNRNATATSTGGAAEAAADAYGIHEDLRGSNTGRIDVISSAGQSETVGNGTANSATLAAGVKGYIGANSGLVFVRAAGQDAKATSENGTADASAIASGTKSNLNADNTGEIDVLARAGTASGLQANANATAFGVENTLQGNNSGAIHVEAFAGTAGSDGTIGSGADAIAIAVGVNNYIRGSNSGTVYARGVAGTATTDGALSAEAITNVYAVNNGVEGDNTGSLIAIGYGGKAEAEGSGNASSYTRVMGLFGRLEGSNTGTVFAETRGGIATAHGSGSASASAEAIGVYLGIRDTGASEQPDNLGVVRAIGIGGTASSVGGPAYGYADVTGLDGALGGENKGLIEVQAVGTSATTQANLTAKAEGLAVGIKGDAEANSGTIFVRATGGEAKSGDAAQANGGARAFGIGYVEGTTRYGIEGDFTNSSLIDVKAVAGTANGVQDKAIAYGVVLNGAATLDNSGLILASATGGAGSEAYQVHAGANALTVTSYGILFGDDMEENFSGTIQADGPANVTFDSATLHVHHSNTTKVNEAYELPDLVAGKDVQQFTTLNTDGIVGYGWGAEIVESSWNTKDQQIIFRYAPKVSSPQLVAQQQRGVIDATQRVGARLLSDLMLGQEAAESEGLLLSYDGQPTSDAAKAVADMADVKQPVDQYGVFYAAPLHLYQSNGFEELGYSAHTTGVLTGYNRVISPELIIGANAFYGHSSLEFDGVYDQAKESVDTYGFGVQGAYRMDDVLFSTQSTFYHTSNTYKDSSVQAKESYTSQNLLTRVAAKYIWEHGINTFTPEVGLSHLWHSRGAFSVDNQNAPDVRYDAVNNHQFSVDASLGWTGTYELEEGELKANARAGLRQILGDGGFEDILRSGANGVAYVTNDSDQTLARVSASLDYTKGNFGASVGVLGEYGENTRDTAFFGRVSYKF